MKGFSTNKLFVVRCTKEEREEIAFLSSQLKTNSKERVAEVLLRALKKLKLEVRK